jgi:hypothetical protein
MKKLILITLMASLCFCSYAQTKDYSKDIKKVVDELKGEIEYSSPYGDAYVTKMIKPGEPKITTLILHAEGIMSNYSAKGVFIKFEDGKVLRYPELKVNCIYNQYKDRSTFAGALTIDSENYEYFTTKKIVEFSLDDNKSKLSKRDADRLLSYIKVVYAAE